MKVEEMSSLSKVNHNRFGIWTLVNKKVELGEGGGKGGRGFVELLVGRRVEILSHQKSDEQPSNAITAIQGKLFLKIYRIEGYSVCLLSHSRVNICLQ